MLLKVSFAELDRSVSQERNSNVFHSLMGSRIDANIAYADTFVKILVIAQSMSKAGRIFQLFHPKMGPLSSGTVPGGVEKKLL